LQGGPGTGKTLIARSMAEIAETPLYRVTCGDIEKNSESAANDLAFILGLSRTWNCMLVLDGAHILLQESSIPSSQKDIIVSNIVEILDRYDGIVILVSSRVGVFDERIISRIQVPLHLANLNHISRKKIWQNIVDQLEEDGEHANVAEIRSRLDDLAAKESNGHQIRNVLKIAKEMATYRHERLDWDHLQQASLLSSGFTI
jgi:AAA+ superfamily predicted ATPase